MYRRSMIFRQVTHDDLGCASYLVGDDGAGVAAVVDPRFEIDVTSTLHGTWVCASSTSSRPTTTPTTSPATAGWPARPARRSTSTGSPRPTTSTRRSTTAGSSRSATSSCARCTRPGHRPEHTAFALIDRARGEEPWAVLSGDSLFVGDIARPDLAVEREEGAREIFRSLHDQLLDAARQLRGVARPPRRIDVRRARDGHEGLLDDRLRARPQRAAARARRRASSSSARSPRSARSRRTSRRSSRSTAGRC